MSTATKEKEAEAEVSATPSTDVDEACTDSTSPKSAPRRRTSAIEVARGLLGLIETPGDD